MKRQFSLTLVISVAHESLHLFWQAVNICTDCWPIEVKALSRLSIGAYQKPIRDFQPLMDFCAYPCPGLQI